MTYNTKQKEEILNIIRKQKKSFTVKTIEKELPSVGLTTIYRMIDKLVKDGVVEKEINNTYIYLEECDHDNHFYLKCESCGNMIHVDCDCISELTNHIKSNHNFKINKEHIIINGLCNKCIKEAN